MATNTLPPHQKKGNFLSGSSSRRASSSSISLSASPKLSPQGIGYSPSNPPAGSGISRTLRSLLPFSGNSKNATSSTSTPPKGPFSGFGSIRKSTTRERERQNSLSNDATPVVSISHPEEETPIRRSVSLSRLEKPLPMHPDALFSGEVHMQASERDLGYILRSPSPVPPLSAELSTIIEADNSGVSKNIPVLLESVSTNPASPPPAIQRDLLFVEQHTNRLRSGGQRTQDPDSSALDLPTDELAEEVREALRKSGSSGGSGKNWFSTDVVIDERRNTHFANSTLNMATVDSDLLALLSPNSVTGKDTARAESDPVEDVSFSPSRTTRFRQASSFLPRLRSSNSPSPSPTTPRLSIHSSPTKASPSTPRATTFNPRIPPSPVLPPSSPSSPHLASSVTSTPPRNTLSHPPVRGADAPPTSVALSTPIARRPRTNIFTHLTRASSDVKTPSSSSRLGPRALRQAIHGITSSAERPHTPQRDLEDANGIQFGRGSLDSRRPHQLGSAAREIGLGRPSLDAPRVHAPAWRVRQRTRSSTSPERAAELDASPPSEVPFQGEPRHRPSIDSARPSLDMGSRPGSVARMREREREQQRTPSLRVIDASDDRISPREGELRTRKRSLSVQERLHAATGRSQLPSAGEYGGGPSRPGSSLSGYGHGARRALGYDPDDPGSVSGGPGPKMEWLGPRTTRAFRDAGLLDFERSRDSPASRSGEGIGNDAAERLLSLRRDRSGSVSASSPLSGQPHTLGGHTARRSASEYNPSHGRSSSRTGFSEVGGATSAASTRMSSGSFSVYGTGNPPYAQGHQGLLDSPTFTLSSSSRERDTTPKSSTSTAPTSISESLGYLTREREREKEELREMRDKHGTEMAALLGALSDSQRTVRMLREENGQLRDRFEHFSGVVRENENLRQACAELENACMALHGECRQLHHELTALKSRRVPPKLTPSWSEGSARSGSRTPNGKLGQSSPLSIDTTPQFSSERSREDEDDLLDGQEEVYDNTMIIHDDTFDDDDNQEEEDTRTPDYNSGPHTREIHDVVHGVAASHNSTSSSTPTHTRRLSTSSSIFPTVPANMTMLLHDDGTALADMNRTSADNSQFHFSVPASPVPPIARSMIVSPSPSTEAAKLPASQPKSHAASLPPVSFRDFAGPSHRSNMSITSTNSISPTTANFSIMSGSPKSLFLRPEHELLLGDLESLDLGIRGTDNVESSQKARADDDAW